MKRLFVSFWNLGLENLPEGSFSHRRLDPSAARDMIGQARQDAALLCVTADDLMAPYKKRQRANHEALRRVLSEVFGISLSLNDFLSQDSSDGEALYFINPLDCVQVGEQASLLIIDCSYTLDRDSVPEAKPAFSIATDTVSFHLIEATGQ